MQNGERDAEVEVAVPHLAESLVSATVIRWLKAPGDEVREYEVLCELATDKVNVEMPSPIEGTLLRILVVEGETADVGAPICVIRESAAKHEVVAESPTDADRQGTRYSPAVARLAVEHGIDLRKVKGTSQGGRINRKDVLAYVQEQTAADAKRADDLHLPPSPIRNLIAERMHRSVAEIPHAWMAVETDVSQLVDLREKLKDEFERKEGVRLTVTPFVIKAVVNAIKDYPILNSTWSSENIVLKRDIHVCVAVGSEESVVTPVLRYADRKTIAGLAIELHDLVHRARTGRLTLDDLQGGSITFNNTGAFGSVLSYPIIQYPQAAMITFESIVRRPVVIQQDMIAIRSMANLCLSLDHSLLDGMVCGRFLQRVKHYLELYGPDTQIY